MGKGMLFYNEKVVQKKNGLAFKRLVLLLNSYSIYDEGSALFL